MFYNVKYPITTFGEALIVERISTILFAFLHPVLSFIFVIIGLVKREPHKWLHIISFILNLLQSLYYGFLAVFAG